MDKGKKSEDPVLSEEERRMLEAMREFEIIAREYLALMEKMDGWLEDLEGDVGSSDLHAMATELSDTMRRFLRQLGLDDGNEEAASISGSGSSGLTDLEPEVSSIDPKLDDECSSTSP